MKTITTTLFMLFSMLIYSQGRIGYEYNQLTHELDSIFDTPSDEIMLDDSTIYIMQVSNDSRVLLLYFFRANESYVYASIIRPLDNDAFLYYRNWLNSNFVKMESNLWYSYNEWGVIKFMLYPNEIFIYPDILISYEVY